MAGFGKSRYWLVIPAILAAFLAVGAPRAQAATQHLPNGLSDFMGGVLPPPGFYWLNYSAMISKDTMRDKDGDKVHAPPAGEGSPFSGKELDVEATVWVEAMRFVYMSPWKLLGANYGAQIILPFYTADLTVTDNSAIGGKIDLVDSEKKGLGDITIDPFILAWHFSPNFHMGFGVDIVCPTGNYDKDQEASQILNKNHFTFEPLVAISYWQPGGVDLSAKIMYDFHTANTNPAPTPANASPDKLEPGQEFHMDLAASYALGTEAARLGVVGYYYTQVTKDKLDGVSDDLSSVAAAGLAFKYWPKMGPFSITGKYYKEFAAKNTTEGENYWLNFTLAF